MLRAGASGIVIASFATGCTMPPPHPPDAPMAGGAVDMSPGAHVQVARNGQWYGATILQAVGDGRVVVHYDNTGNEWNEVVGPDRVKALPGAGPARDYKPGERVLVTFQSRLLVADVVTQVAADQWRVHYDGFGAEAGENVGPERMRRPFAGLSNHAVGEALVVEVNGQPLPAKVIAVSAADKWVVRFDTYGPQYDQEIGAERIRGGAAPAQPPPNALPPPPPGPPPVAVGDKLGDKVEKAEKPKPKPAPDGAPAPQAGPPAVGETVLIHHRGVWFTATVAELTPTSVKVKYASGGDASEGLEHVLREPASLRGLQYGAGQQVIVEYKGVYVPAKVLRAEGKDYKVRFDGFGPDADEVVVGRRLRPR